MKYFSAEFWRKIEETVLEYTLVNYDYCYLDAMHYKNKMRDDIETIIVGSSHAMNGIVEQEISEKDNVINFSISSQDLYFDFLNIKKAFAMGGRSIKKCIINIGYYMLYQDLSLSKNMVHLMPQVYYPLFGDTHHYVMEREYDFWQYISHDKGMLSPMTMSMFCSEWAKGFFLEEPSYYGSLKTREQNNILGLKKIQWASVQEKSKEDYTIDRTNKHNQLRKHLNSFEENKQIIEEMVSYLWERNVTPIFVIMPFTKYYNTYIDERYKEEIWGVLEALELPVEFLDMNDYPELFDDSDFLDSDHLNLKGAVKASRVLRDFLAEVI